MIDPKKLLTTLQKRVLLLEDDLRTRCNEHPDVDAPLKAEYETARAKGRTGLTYNAWRDEELTQIAVAWILAGVFVRFLEDNELIDVPFLAGGNAVRHQRAQDEHSLFFRQHPTSSERDYFEHVFNTVGKLPGMKDFFDRKHNPLWRVGPTADAAKALLEFWRKIDPDTGHIVHDFTDPEWNTRFLGDLYQDLSELARKRYALLQTPEFVEQFILDRTLTPAISTFGYKAVRMIDPTCGSGHFLLGGFHRLFKLWRENEPGENPTVLAQRALDQVYGVDLNPNVVAIARFRLLLSALRAAEIRKLKNSPDFRLNLVAGDSLLHGSRFPSTDSHEGIQQTFGGDEMFRDELKHFYESEDREGLHRILGQQYHVVVGNPPYITVKDKALNEAYRNRFDSCHRKYSLAVPFMERFFDLALKGDGKGLQSAGYLGMITANSFMKREFGKKLIEQFIPKWDLTHVIDTAGAYIPGHGTPTVILFGKHQPPVSGIIRTLLGVRGEPETPSEPSLGLVWQALLKQIDQPGSESEWLSTADSPRGNFHLHPWSIGGGGAAELKELMDEAGEDVLRAKISDLGMSTYSGADEVYLLPEPGPSRLGGARLFAPSIAGDDVRDFSSNSSAACLVPYEKRKLIPIREIPDGIAQHLWLHRTILANRLSFGRTHAERGMAWYEPSMFFFDRFESERKICHAYVATHNQFALLNGSFATNRHAPVINLNPDANEDDHFQILGLLNSSAACFWLKQVCQPKATITGDISTDKGRPEANRYEFASTSIYQFPMPRLCGIVGKTILHVSAKLHELGIRLRLAQPAAVVAKWSEEDKSFTDLRDSLKASGDSCAKIKALMILLQEELDWAVYTLYGIVSDVSVIPEKFLTIENGIGLDERPFAWQSPQAPKSLPIDLHCFFEARRRKIDSNPILNLVENPVCKRPWLGRQGVYGLAASSYEEHMESDLRSWLLARLEGYFHEGHRVCELKDGFCSAAHGFAAALQPVLTSTNQLATVVEADTKFLCVAEIYTGGPGFSVSKLVRELVETESVPFLPFQRYKETGLRKRQDWEHVWDLQRKEDAIDAEENVYEPGITDTKKLIWNQKANSRKKKEIGVIPVPPKYSSGDFKKPNWWKLRGKLDVPKERWIIYPGAERDGDPSPIIAWAGWDHLQQAKALASYYVDASTNLGWSSERLQPLLAGLADLLPWLKQWHNEFDPEVGSGLGDYFDGFLDEEARKQGTTIESLHKMRFGENT